MKKSFLLVVLVSGSSLLQSCGGGGGGASAQTGVTPTVTIAASSSSVPQGQSLGLTWSSTNAGSCTASANPSESDWAGTRGTSGSQSVTPTSAGSVAYTLTCAGAGGTASGAASVTVTARTATHFSVTAPISAPSAIPFKFTVTALDPSNSTVPSYSGTVHFSSSDPHAQLPPDSLLVSGSKLFSATLTTAGNQTITATDTGTSSVAGTSNSVNVGALADAFPVEMFGAKGDGVTDDTPAIQSAINAAAAAGGGAVVFKVARYYTTGSFILPAGVSLSGLVEGPFDVVGVDPAVTAIAPTLLVTNTTTPFVTLQGLGAGVTDLLFHYPNQVKTTASAPNVYPYTIVEISAGGKVVRCTVTNAYDFLDIQFGRKAAQDLYIGAFHIGVHVDNSEDVVTLHNLYHGVLWDEVEGAPYPTAMDGWVLSNGTALVVQRMDSLDVHDLYVFSRYAGMLLTDSPNHSLNPPYGYGTASNIDLETVKYGVIATSSNTPGYEFTNLQVGAVPGGGQAAVALQAGGSAPPDILVNGGSVRGNWVMGPFPTPASGHLKAVNIIGYDLP